MLEDWEIAPGRLTSPSSSQTIAYSSTYLSQTQNTSLFSSSGVTFGLVPLAPGTMISFPVEEERLRICSVAQGFVSVRLRREERGDEGEEEKGGEFKIGPNGMWKVDAGWECSIVNQYHAGAVVHVTSVPEGVEEV